MARAPIPATDPALEEPPVDAPPAPVVDEEAAEPTVVCTVLRAADGSLILEAGDEPEMAEGAEPMAMAEGKTFPADEGGIGALMTAILDLVDPENPDGPAAQENFQAGFGAEEAAAPPAA